MKKLLAPSILSADFGNLRHEVTTVAQAGAEIIHVDCMDNHFVPNLTIGPVVLKSLTGIGNVTYDVHLMVTDPASLIEPFIQAGAQMISVQVETDRHIHRTLEQIKNGGAQAGIVLNPGTPLLQIQEMLPWCDYILLMTVNPGFAAQQFIGSMLAKIEQAREMIARRGYQIPIQVDGGIKLANLRDVLKAGADIIVAGSAIFGTPDPAAQVKKFKNIMDQEPNISGAEILV
ncbi:ribulose-phosphate 3-epimerase [candidate division CSSED10-310 bacterium]|uniref:Ribulose-phosphate 3-epimerase n=1 Tax=candidate division CSSED10-310 bacterium TaxID=2855610 RepID=A0ABV6YZ33_UNCC1